MKNDIRRAVTILFAVLCFIVVVFPAFAQDPENGTGISYQPVRNVDLGVPSLTLDSGEKYTFSVRFEPEDTPVTQLTWFNTDNTVVGLNQLTNTVTALTPGNARLMAESFDGEAWAVCEITVKGTEKKDLSRMVEGKSLLTLSEKDRAKIEAAQIIRRLDLLEMSVINEEAFQKLQNQDIQVIAEVQPGTEDAESERALALGMSVAYPMRYLHLVSLHGSFIQILDFVKDNNDLIRIFKEPDVYFFDPLPETGASSSEPKTDAVNYTTMLEGKTEELTSVSKIHNLGYTGKGITIAIIDTGLNSSHEQFAGRVLAENCFSNSYRYKLKEGCEPCNEFDKDCDFYKCYLKEDFSACKGGTAAGHGTSYSAFPGGAVKPGRFNHGSHVAGIAAGKNGMAPGANIVAVQVQSEVIDPAYISLTNPDGYFVTMNNEDVLSAYDWVLGLQDKLKNEGKPVSILNLSLGGGRFDETCDTQSGCEDHFSALKKLNKAGILVVASSGNRQYDKALIMPACLSNVLAVGALEATDEPYITASSNHSPLVDILAPGINIRSAFLVNDAGQPVTDHYGKMSGTSMAAPAVSGSLALLMEAYPGLGLEEYKPMLVEMSSKTADRRISIDDTVNGTGTVFEYTKPVLDFSNFNSPEQMTKTLRVTTGADSAAMVENIKTQNESAAIIADLSNEKAEVIVSGGVTATGRNANGVVVKVASAEGKFSLFVADNLTADNAAIVIDRNSKGKIDILVTEKITGGNDGILIDENVVTKALDGDELLSNVSITAYEIEPKNRVVRYGSGNRSAEKALEKSINYIIRMDQPENGLLLAVDQQGDPWSEESHEFITANPGEKVYFRVIPLDSEDFDPEKFEFQVFDKSTGRRLSKTADGFYFTVVQNGGPVHVFAKAVQKPDSPQKPEEPQTMDFYRITDFFDRHEMPKTGFSAVHPQHLSEKPLSVQYQPTRLTLQLPTLDVVSEIVTVPYTEGEYPVDWLGDTVGMLEGNSLPGEGITVLTGHNHLNTTEAGPFALLGSLVAGDGVMITDSRGSLQTWYVYESAKIPAGSFSRIAGDVKENALVLITCEDESPDGGYLNRRVVLAEKQ